MPTVERSWIRATYRDKRPPFRKTELRPSFLPLQYQRAHVRPHNSVVEADGFVTGTLSIAALLASPKAALVSKATSERDWSTRSLTRSRSADIRATQHQPNLETWRLHPVAVRLRVGFGR
jgi:hypothetical protein